MTKRNPEPAVVRNAFKVGKARKKILSRREKPIGYLKPTRQRAAQASSQTQRHRDAVERGLEFVTKGQAQDADEAESLMRCFRRAQTGARCG